MINLLSLSYDIFFHFKRWRCHGAMIGRSWHWFSLRFLLRTRCLHTIDPLKPYIRCWWEQIYDFLETLIRFTVTELRFFASRFVGRCTMDFGGKKFDLQRTISQQLFELWAWSRRCIFLWCSNSWDHVSKSSNHCHVLRKGVSKVRWNVGKASYLRNGFFIRGKKYIVC